MTLQVKYILGLSSFIFFLLIGYISIFILRADTTLQSLMQIFYILAIIIGISLKTFLPKIRKDKKIYFYIIALTPVVAFIYLLIFSTGSIFSPYLILTHFFTIAVSFLISPLIAVSFVFATISLLVYNSVLDTALKTLSSQNPFLGILYVISYLGLIPLSYILAKEYKVKEEWAKILEKQIATSKTQEEEFLKNISEVIIVIDVNFKILYINKKAEEYFNLNNDAINKNIYELFKFKNKDGIDIYSYSLPFTQTIQSKQPQKLLDLQIKTNVGSFKKIDMKIIPAIESEKSIGLILIIQDRSNMDTMLTQKEETSTSALRKFLELISNQKDTIQTLTLPPSEQQKLDSLKKQNQTLIQAAEDLMYTIRIESGEIGVISNIFDIGKLLDEIIIKENKKGNSTGVLLYPRISENKKDILMPKLKKVELKFAKRNFPEIFIIGDETSVEQSVTRVLKLLYLTSSNSSPITVDVLRDKELATINLISHKSVVPDKQAMNLFEKYYGQLSGLPELKLGSGLEGFIAKTILERMGANVTTSTTGEKSLTVIIRFGVYTKAPPT